jgi:hypothetical protein
LKFNTSDLSIGNYIAYALDSSFNISEASGLIRLQSPVNAEFVSKDSEINILYRYGEQQISIKSTRVLRKIDVYSILGEKIHSVNCHEKSYEISGHDFQKGIYLVRVVDTQGKIKLAKVCVL